MSTNSVNVDFVVGETLGMAGGQVKWEHAWWGHEAHAVVGQSRP